MSEQKGTISDLKVGRRVLVVDQWTGRELKGKVTWQTIGGFYWEADDGYTYWSPLGGTWEFEDDTAGVDNG